MMLIVLTSDNDQDADDADSDEDANDADIGQRR